MNAYPKYKDSGIDWIGKIPSHWALSKIKYSFENLDNLREPIASENRERRNPKYDYYGASGVIDKVDGYNVDDTVLLIAEDGANLVMRNLPLIYKASGKIWVNNHAHILKPLQDVDYEYMYYYLESIDYNDFITGSAQPKLSQGNLANVDVLRPTLSEQKAIAVYLDEKTAKIDELMAEKTNQVKDLQSYRTSVITEAVTRGINSDAPLRQSGIDWIGEIPEGWKVVKTSYIYDVIGSGTTPDTNNYDYYGETGYNWLQTGDLNDGEIIQTSKHITKLAITEKGLKSYPINSIVIAMYGATIGKLGLLKIETTVNQACCVLVPSERVDYKYSFYFFQAAKNSLIRYASGGGQPNISQAIIKDFKVTVPPLSEQQEIAAYLDEKTAKIDKLIGELNAQLTELADYKQAVISEAVTGKVDVRNYRI
jgi:type I restriction enzyme S subunit